MARLVGALRVLTHAGVPAAALTATILFRDGTARLIGFVVLAAVLGGVYWRYRCKSA